MFLRVANLAFAAAGVAFTYLLARDLSGGVGRIGVRRRPSPPSSRRGVCSPRR